SAAGQTRRRSRRVRATLGASDDPVSAAHRCASLHAALRTGNNLIHLSNNATEPTLRRRARKARGQGREGEAPRGAGADTPHLKRTALAMRRNALQAFRAQALGARLSALHRGIFGASTLGHLPQAFWRYAHSDPAAWRHDLRPGIACCSPGGGGSPLPEGIVPPSGRLRAAGRWKPLPALSELPPHSGRSARSAEPRIARAQGYKPRVRVPLLIRPSGLSPEDPFSG